MIDEVIGIGCDWGTTSLRAYLLGRDAQIIEKIEAQKGIMSVKDGDFEKVFEEIVGTWMDVYPTCPIVLSGMIGSRQGWLEAPYIECPAQLNQLAKKLTVINLIRKRKVFLVPGLTFKDEEGIPDTMTQKDYDEGGIKSQMEDMFGVKLYGDETFDELMIIKNTGKHPRDMADGGKVPAAPSQLVSESDMILGYRGDDAYGGGRAGGPPGGPGESSSDAGFANTSPSRAGPVDMGFIDSGPTVNPNLAKKGPTLVGPGPTGEGPGPDYVMSTTPEPTLLDNIINAGTNIINNPITRTLGLATLTAINPTLAGKVRQGMMVKGMLDLAGDISLEDLTLGGGDVTGQTTALYKDGGLASMFVEKR